MGILYCNILIYVDFTWKSFFLVVVFVFFYCNSFVGFHASLAPGAVKLLYPHGMTLRWVALFVHHLFQYIQQEQKIKQEGKKRYNNVSVKCQRRLKWYSALKLALTLRKSPWNSTSAIFPDECHWNRCWPANTLVFKASMSRIWRRKDRRGAVRSTGSVRMQMRSRRDQRRASCVHHDVRRLRVWGVDAYVVRLDSYLHRWRSVDENPARVVGVGRCRILKGSGWGEQLNVTICEVKHVTFGKYFK